MVRKMRLKHRFSKKSARREKPGKLERQLEAD
jgi:hypothetical protein